MGMFKSSQEIIADIHNEFDTAQERLLIEATRIINSTSNDLPQIAERLKNVGFINTPVAKRGDKLSKQLVSSKEQADLIQYYRTAYPFIKFLTENELYRICNKYGLIHRPAQNYIGDVPEKNLCDIENAQELKDSDRPKDLKYSLLKKDKSFLFVPTGHDWTSIWGSAFWRIPKRINNKHFDSQYDANRYLQKHHGFTHTYLVSSVLNVKEDRSGLFICAPKSHFKGETFGLSIIEAKDPIVFRYVRGGVQVITKWGLEASDPSLVVPVLN